MKCTKDNVELFCKVLQSQLEDENGRGEFDDESDLLYACEVVIKWIEDDYKFDHTCQKCKKVKKDVRFEGSEEINICDKCLQKIKRKEWEK